LGITRGPAPDGLHEVERDETIEELAFTPKHGKVRIEFCTEFIIKPDSRTKGVFAA